MLYLCTGTMPQLHVADIQLQGPLGRAEKPFG